MALRAELMGLDVFVPRSRTRRRSLEQDHVNDLGLNYIDRTCCTNGLNPRIPYKFRFPQFKVGIVRILTR